MFKLSSFLNVARTLVHPYLQLIDLERSLKVKNIQFSETGKTLETVSVRICTYCIYCKLYMVKMSSGTTVRLWCYLFFSYFHTFLTFHRRIRYIMVFFVYKQTNKQTKNLLVTEVTYDAFCCLVQDYFQIEKSFKMLLRHILTCPKIPDLCTLTLCKNAPKCVETLELSFTKVQHD